VSGSFLQPPAPFQHQRSGLGHQQRFQRFEFVDGRAKGLPHRGDGGLGLRGVTPFGGDPIEHGVGVCPRVAEQSGGDRQEPDREVDAHREGAKRWIPNRSPDQRKLGHRRSDWSVAPPGEGDGGRHPHAAAVEPVDLTALSIGRELGQAQLRQRRQDRRQPTDPPQRRLPTGAERQVVVQPLRHHQTNRQVGSGPAPVASVEQHRSGAGQRQRAPSQRNPRSHLVVHDRK